MRGQPGLDKRLYAWLPLSLALIRKLHVPLVCLDYFSWYLSMAFYTTRHWQTSGRLVLKLNVCTVVCDMDKAPKSHFNDVVILSLLPFIFTYIINCLFFHLLVHSYIWSNNRVRSYILIINLSYKWWFIYPFICLSIYLFIHSKVLHSSINSIIHFPISLFLFIHLL